METNSNPWFHHQLSRQQSSYFNSLDYPLNLGPANNIHPSLSPCANIVSSNGTLTDIAFSGVPCPNQCPPNECHGWFGGLSRYHQAFNDVANIVSSGKAPYFSRENNEKTNTANPGSGSAQKRFLVFDQSGDQTTMFFSPAIGPPVRLPSEGPKLKHDYHVNKMVEINIIPHQEPILTNEYHAKLGDDVENDMREDTEELNALLYSDDDYYYEEDQEEASTGHSPSAMTDFDKEVLAKDNEEEVASNFGQNKRTKLSNGGFQVSPLADSAASAKLKDCFECGDDAESSCSDKVNQDLGGFGLLGVKKRSRKDQIRETLSSLQSIIPGGKGKGKDAILIFDEAIDYLKFLKATAQTLGVHTI